MATTRIRRINSRLSRRRLWPIKIRGAPVPSINNIRANDRKRAHLAPEPCKSSYFVFGDKDSRRDIPPEILQRRYRQGWQLPGLSHVMFGVNRRADLFAGAQKILRLDFTWGLEG